MDVILDANCLGDFFYQYFSEDYANYGDGIFKPNGNITKNLAYRINSIMKSESNIGYGSVIASAFAFIEISRKWREIVNNRFMPYQLWAFINHHPIWFNIAAVDQDLMSSFAYVPNVNSDLKTIEWTDAIYVATVFSRGDAKTSTLVTSDGRLKKLMADNGRVVMYNP